MLKKFHAPLFFTRRFYYILVGNIVLFVLSYELSLLFIVAQVGFLILLIIGTLDYIFLFTPRLPLAVRRETPDQLSNGDENNITIQIENYYPFQISLSIIDELPDQLQQRQFLLQTRMGPGSHTSLNYQVRPTHRGQYHFHGINAYITGTLGLVTRRIIFVADKMVKVLPSFLSMKRFELLAHSNNLSEAGQRNLRKLGHSLEFEQIRAYITGDDIRSINWKATGRTGGQLMINNFTDEKSQQVYCVIDKGRVMKMPFLGLTLLDYAINASFVLSRVVLSKRDKARVIAFSDQIGSFLPADSKAIQLSNILELLYHQQTGFPETDYEKLYALFRTKIRQRSLIILFTNFESLAGLQRQLPYIRGMARNHLVLVIFFENTELRGVSEMEITDIEQLYVKTIADKFAYEKRLMVKELQQHGVATILTTPQRLIVHAVNKYLEIKARQAI